VGWVQGGEGEDRLDARWSILQLHLELGSRLELDIVVKWVLEGVDMPTELCGT
jgi:hypothetical protein